MSKSWTRRYGPSLLGNDRIDSGVCMLLVTPLNNSCAAIPVSIGVIQTIRCLTLAAFCAFAGGGCATTLGMIGRPCLTGAGLLPRTRWRGQLILTTL
jgi:hypothetical protein